MNKCEHGEKMTRFCATQNCQVKEAAGCELCIKKYHSHLVNTVQLTEDDITILLKKFALDNAVKPKCRILQEAIYNYFNQIKNELVSALEASCKNIINQIGYPYLSVTNALTTYKRLKNREYRKLMQKDFRVFFELASKINEKDLAREEAKIYNAEIKTISEIIGNLDSLFKNIEGVVKNYSAGYAHDATYYLKVTDIIKSIGAESPMRIKRNDPSRDKDIVENKTSSKEVESRLNGKQSNSKETDNKSNPKQMPKLTLINSPHAFLNPKFDYKGFEAKASQLRQKMQKVQAEFEPLLPAHSVQLPKNSKDRDISLDRKLVKEPRFTQEPEKHKEQGSESRVPNQKIENLRMQLNHREMEINEKKKILMDIMKPGERQERPLEKLESIDLSPIKTKPIDFNYPKREQLSTDTKSLNQSKSSKSSQDLSGLEEQSKLSDTKNYAFAKLPIEEVPRKQQEKLAVNKKLMIVPTDIKSISNKVNQLDSPLYKKRKVQNFFDQKQWKDENEEKGEQLGRREGESKVLGREIVEIKENEEKSLALLLKSLSLSAEEGVTYLESSLKYADNNLSAAQYLSYLYLQLNRPKDCLTLCNRILDKLEYTADSELLSMNINNNKAAALNVLGRYSEAILILEQCITYAEKDILFKNLGDSYFSIGMYEKAILNYERSSRLSNLNDECFYNLAVCFYIQQNYDCSKLAIRKALEVQPKNEAYLELQSHIIGKLKAI